MGKQWKQCQTLFLGGSKITADGDCSHEIKRSLLLRRKVISWNPNNIQDQRAHKGRDTNQCILHPTHIHLWEIQPVHSEGDQPWDFFGRTDAKAETPVLWPPYAKSWLIGKDPDAGKDWEQEEKGMTEDEVAGWHHRLYGHEFGWTPGVGDGQGGLACCDSWRRRESDTTEWLNWAELNK